MCGAVSTTKISVAIDTDSGVYLIGNDKIYSLYGEGVIKDLDDVIKSVQDFAYVAAENSRFQYMYAENGEKTLSVTKAKTGKKIDGEALREDILSCLKAGGGRIKAKYITIEPEYTEKDFCFTPSKRGEFTTAFYDSSIERAHNIKLSASALNEITVYPEKVLSFNALVGIRSEKTGYKNAKVIVDGKFVEGIGGGVCQVSTTLYNAALLAGLEVTEYHRHTVAVSYVEKSFDAMVSYGYADLKIKNTTGAPIFIESAVSDGKITFDVYGKKMNYSILRESVTVKTIEPTITTITNENLKSGETRYVTYPKCGYETEGYLLYCTYGKTEKKLLRQDKYKKIDGIKEVGA